MGGLATGPQAPRSSRRGKAAALLHRSYSRVATTSPSWTVWPSWTGMVFTTPARGDSTGISIFMDSSTITGSPSLTASPGWATTWKTTPVMWALMSSGIERSLFDHLGVHGPAPEVGMRHHAPEKGDRGLDPVDHTRGQGGLHPCNRVRARGAPRDEFHQQRIVVHGHHAPLSDAALDAHPVALRQHERGDRSRRRQKPLGGILGVDADLNGRSALSDLVLAPR